MLKSYKTLSDHEELLGEKGYLSENFKPTWKMSYWLNEMKEIFETARYNATVNEKKETFCLETMGKFQYDLDRVFFRLFYEYNPKYRSLRIKTIMARLGTIRKTYFLKDSKDLPEAEKVHKSLSERYNLKYKSTLFKRMEKNLSINRRII
jgi:hypothetical protein